MRQQQCITHAAYTILRDTLKFELRPNALVDPCLSWRKMRYILGVWKFWAVGGGGPLREK